MKRLWLLIFAAWALTATAQRTETLLQEGWRFHLGDAENAQSIEFNDKDWEIITESMTYRRLLSDRTERPLQHGKQDEQVDFRGQASVGIEPLSMFPRQNVPLFFSTVP